jgi:colanic acid/amylovoran biosynthesis protein
MKILFYGQGEYSNRGCEAIIKGTISILSKQINNLDVTVASFHAEQDKKHVINGITSYVNHGIVEDRWSKDWFWAVLCNRLLHNPELREKRLQKQVINTAHKVDAVFSIGGDNYCYGVPYFAYAIDKEIRKTNKTLFLWGASINDEAIDGKMVKDLERFDRIFVRESLTLEMFVGARTHATIAAYSSCVPTLVVGYSVKARGIARDIFGSEENMVIPVQSLEHEDDLVNAFKYIQETKIV